MNPALAGVALAITIGAIVAVSVRDARTAILGLAVLLIGSPFLADPLADTLGLAARVVGAVLAAYLLWIALRTAPAPDGRVAARLAGRGARSRRRRPWSASAPTASGSPGQGPALAQAAGFALAALAVAPLWTGRDVMRVGIGLLLLMDGALLVRVALGGTPGALEQLVTAGLVAGLGGAIAILAVSASRRRRRRLRARRCPGGRAGSGPADARPVDRR